MKLINNFKSSRSPIYSTRGIVATSQPLAVSAGLGILSSGGNAADAAVATAAALNVTEPVSTGLGGDCFALYYQSDSGQVSALNGSGRAPSYLSLNLLESKGFNSDLPDNHPLTITVPGACAAWFDLIEAFGSRSMGEILSPAIRLAETGFPVAPITAHFWKLGYEKQLKHAPGGLELTNNGYPPMAGEIFRNPGLARTFRKISEGGKTAFYTGEIAEAIAEVVLQAGGCLRTDDLAAHHSTWDTPISTTYHGLRVWECPPNGQGLVALLALNILEGFELGQMPQLSSPRLHLEIEALRLAFADAGSYISDPEFSAIPLDQLLSKDYASQRRRLIDPRKASLNYSAGYTCSGSGTVYLSVVDDYGNACSFINSNYRGFGTGIVPHGWGFSLQNRGANFSLDPDHPNVVAPGKRPYHTIIPGMVTVPNDNTHPTGKGDDLYACFGVMGGFFQPQGHVQVLTALVNDNCDPQQALDRPRYYLFNGKPGGPVAFEKHMPPEVVEYLSNMGHPILDISPDLFEVFGRGQIILRDAKTRVLCAGSDNRADGCAMTY